MKNKNFFYQQYNQINWKNQENTRINGFINNYIVENIILKKTDDSVSIFDIGFGIGFFLETLKEKLGQKFKRIKLAGCEPSQVNFGYFKTNKEQEIEEVVSLSVQSETFLNAEIEDNAYDFVSAIYVFTHFLFEELELAVRRIHSILKPGGKFILIVANEEYLEEKLASQKDLFIERTEEEFNGKKYKQVLHYSRIPEIGTVVDYNREDRLYIDIFTKFGFKLDKRERINDSGFISTLFVFEKQ